MPKVKFTKKDILLAAIEIMKQEGIKNLSARKIASKLKGSTAPIYANYKNMDELKKEIIIIAEEKLKEYLNVKYSERILLDNSIGFVVFAREEKELYRAIFLDGSESFQELFDNTIENLLDREYMMKSFPNLSESEAKKAIGNLWYFIYGYGTLVAVGILNDESNEKIKEKILEIADNFKNQCTI